MRIELAIDNIYDGETVSTTRTADVPAPPCEDDNWDEWAFDHLFPLTGSGRPCGTAAYFVMVTACDNKALVGREFEFGV